MPRLGLGLGLSRRLGRAGGGGTVAAPIDFSARTTPFKAGYSVLRVSTYSATGPVVDIAGTPVNYASNVLPNTTTGKVSKWYDMYGGFDAVQATDANRFICDPSVGKIGDFLSLINDGTNDGAIATRFLTLPAGLILPTKSCSVYAVVQNTKSNALSTLVSFFDGVSADSLVFQVSQGLALKGAAANQTMPTYPPVSPAILGFVSSASAITLYQAGRSQVRAAASSSVNTAGGMIGNATAASNKGNQKWLALFIADGIDSAGDVAATRAALLAAFPPVQETWNKLYVLDGNSIGMGTDATLCQSATQQLQDLMGTTSTLFFVFATFGATLRSISALGTGRLTTPNSGWTLTGSPTKKYYEQEALTNDLALNLTITGAANNGSGLIRLLVPTGLSALITGNVIHISAVTGTTEANGDWTVTVIDSTHIDLQGSTFTNTYVSGGVINTTNVQMQTDLATNATAAISLGYLYICNTILPKGTITAYQETVRNTHNTWIRANYVSVLGASGLIDGDADVRLQNPLNATYYFDQLHLTNAGYGIIAALRKALLLTI